MEKINIDELVNKFKEEYKFLYDNDNVAGEDEAINYFDITFLPASKKVGSLAFRLLKEFNNKRQDIISSDREAAAFIFALDSLGYLDKIESDNSLKEDFKVGTNKVIEYYDDDYDLYDITNNNYKENLSKNKLTEGTSNFYSHKYFPLLVFKTWDEFETDEEDDEIIENDGTCILDEYDIRALENDLDEFNYDLRNENEFAYDNDIQIVVEPGYYEGGQLKVEGETWIKHNESENKDLIEKINKFLQEMKKKYNLTELSTRGRFSNGASVYDIKKEALEEDSKAVIGTDTTMGDAYNSTNDVYVPELDALYANRGAALDDLITGHFGYDRDKYSMYDVRVENGKITGACFWKSLTAKQLDRLYNQEKQLGNIKDESLKENSKHQWDYDTYIIRNYKNVFKREDIDEDYFFRLAWNHFFADTDIVKKDLYISDDHDGTNAWNLLKHFDLQWIADTVETSDESLTNDNTPKTQFKSKNKKYNNKSLGEKLVYSIRKKNIEQGKNTWKEVDRVDNKELAIKRANEVGGWFEEIDEALNSKDKAENIMSDFIADNMHDLDSIMLSDDDFDVFSEWFEDDFKVTQELFDKYLNMLDEAKHYKAEQEFIKDKNAETKAAEMKHDFQREEESLNEGNIGNNMAGAWDTDVVIIYKPIHSEEVLYTAPMSREEAEKELEDDYYTKDCEYAEIVDAEESDYYESLNESIKLNWKETPYGFSEADYKGFVITKGQYYATGMSDNPNEITVDFYGDDAYFDSIEDAIEAIDKKQL